MSWGILARKGRRARDAPHSGSPSAHGGIKPFIFSHVVALDEASPLCARVTLPAVGAGFESIAVNLEESMKTKQIRKSSSKIVDSRRVRFGAGNAPRVLRAPDAATRDSKKVRFGAGNAPAGLRK